MTKTTMNGHALDVLADKPELDDSAGPQPTELTPESAEPSDSVVVEDDSPPAAEADSEADANSASEDKLRRFRARRPSGRTLLAAVGVVLLVAAVTTAVILGQKLRAEQAVADASQQALATAQQYAVVLTSVDGAKLDENFAAVLAGATGEFKDMYAQSSQQLKQVLIDNKAQAQGKVIAAAVKSATADQVEVMLFLDQSVTNSVNPQPRLDRNRIIMTMRKVDGRWLASKVELP